VLVTRQQFLEHQNSVYHYEKKSNMYVNNQHNVGNIHHLHYPHTITIRIWRAAAAAVTAIMAALTNYRYW
jgi:hypothetical protein